MNIRKKELLLVSYGLKMSIISNYCNWVMHRSVVVVTVKVCVVSLLGILGRKRYCWFVKFEGVYSGDFSNNFILIHRNVVVATVNVDVVSSFQTLGRKNYG